MKTDIEQHIENLSRLVAIAEFGYQQDDFIEHIYIDKDIVVRTMEILNSGLIKQPEIYPTGCNTIQLEYEMYKTFGGNGSYLEFQIGKDSVELFCMPYDEVEYHFYNTLYSTDVKEIVKYINYNVMDFYTKYSDHTIPEAKIK